MHGLYVITHAENPAGYTHYQLAKMALKGGAQFIQLRDKKMEARELMKIGIEIRQLCEHYGARLIINDRIDLAYATDAHGVHLGQQDLPISVARNILGEQKIIGGSASTIKEAQALEAGGADYIGFGHIYNSTTKQKSYAPRGIETLRQVVREVSLPVFAIGGITMEDAGEVAKTGVAGLAVSSAVYSVSEPIDAAIKLASLFGDTKPPVPGF